MKKPFVISISGLSGSGKTTVTNALKARFAKVAVISLDDYGEQVYLDRDINEWSANSSDDEWHTEPIAADVEQLLSESLDYIILDYPFGYGNRIVGQYIDLTVFIDVPLDVALARRIIRDYTSRAENTNVADVEEVSLAGLDRELRFYLDRSRLTYARMPEMQKPTSDLVVDGTKTPEEIADEILGYIDTQNRASDRIDGSTLRRIILLGANGSGKTTLGRKLARVLNFAHIDVEEYYFYPAEIPYTAMRPEEERNAMLLSDMKKHGSFVMSGDISGWGEEFITGFDLVIFLSAPTDIRLKRIENREYKRWGDRVRMGGDMYEQSQKFKEFAASRDITQLERKAILYSCPILRVDSTKTLKENIDEILTYLNTRNHYEALINESEESMK